MVYLCNGNSERVSHTLMVTLYNLVSLNLKVQWQVTCHSMGVGGT
jgi:hypothetical protein